MDRVWDTLHRAWELDKGTVTEPLLREIYELQAQNQFEEDSAAIVSRTESLVVAHVDRLLAEDNGDQPCSSTS